MKSRSRMNSVHFYLSDEELQRVDKKVADLGIQNRSTYLRKMVLDGYCVQIDLAQIRELTSLLRRCSNNLNQYARMANATGSFYVKDIQELKERLEVIWEGVQEILREAGNIK